MNLEATDSIVKKSKINKKRDFGLFFYELLFLFRLIINKSFLKNVKQLVMINGPFLYYQ